VLAGNAVISQIVFGLDVPKDNLLTYSSYNHGNTAEKLWAVLWVKSLDQN
jgi:hypothetical protein